MSEETQHQSDEKIEQEKPGFLEKAKTFTESVISKGMSGNKAEDGVKTIRMMSCHGDVTNKLPPCSERKDSEKFPGSHYCGACGCGDKEMTQLSPRKLENGEDAYIKLDFPKVHCPLKMPGFTNYLPSEKGVSENPRKVFIELTFGREVVKGNSK